jgi:glycosyltransferase involved in cell wall biosynthesis
MIVKNEMGVLKRAFDSIYEYLDYWVICDTGSTDGTQKFTKEYFQEKGIKGELLQHEWEDFGTNRTKAVQAAQNKADYLVLMDADFIFCIKDPKFKANKNLNLDGYQIKYEGGLDYRQMLFGIRLN